MSAEATCVPEESTRLRHAAFSKVVVRASRRIGQFGLKTDIPII